MLQLSDVQKKAEENRDITSGLLPLNYDNICYNKSSQMILKSHLWFVLQNLRADSRFTPVTRRKNFLLSPDAEINFLPTLPLNYFSFPAQDAQAPALKPHPTQFQTRWSQFVRLDGSDLHKLRRTKPNVQATECSHPIFSV